MGTKKVIKKKPTKNVAKKITRKRTPKKSTEIVIRVEQPTMQSLEPIKEKSKYMLPATWIKENQVLQMLQRTPEEHIYTRPGKGGKDFQYVTGTYIKKVLNFVFGWNWDFEVVEHGKEGKQVWVLGKLTVKDSQGHSITKNQFGRADIKMLKAGGMVDYGNDLKAATTDALKKCASEFGIASDIYGKAEFKDVGKEIKEDTQEVPEAEVIIDAETNITKMPEEYLCHGATKFGCGTQVTKAEAEFSKKMFKKILCRNCQQLKKDNK